MTETLCKLSGVVKNFRLPSGSIFKVLDQIDLEIRTNEILALLGPSGCGKSTLMRILAGLVEPDEGSVECLGKPLVGLNPSTAIVFQSFALYPWLTVRQNIAEALHARGIEREAAAARTERVIHVVGLAGFDEAYPRELSGGMKQRAGIARALAVEPEILCMDEPFSQVDALTAETLRGEVVRFWRERNVNPKTIFMVSHDVKEVVFMATRIVVMAAKPGRIRMIIDNPLPFPRDYNAPEFLRLVDRIHAVITETEMPDVPSAIEEARAADWLPLPASTASQVIGLLEILDDHGGKESVFGLVDEIGREFGKILAVVKAAELLDLVDTPHDQVVLTDLGRAFLSAGVPERKRIFKEQVLRLRMFADVLDLIAHATPNHALDDDVVLSQLAIRLPYEDVDRMFATFVNWGRHADLFDHDADRQVLFLEPPPAADA
jgi:NitT/TauT family transport system ATP-binding protein